MEVSCKFHCQDHSVDGIYNLGVRALFPDMHAARISAEFRRILKTDGKAILLRPPEYGLSERVLKYAHLVLHKVFKKNTKNAS